MPEQLELARCSGHEIWNYDVGLGERVRPSSTSTVRRGSIGVTTEIPGKKDPCSYGAAVQLARMRCSRSMDQLQRTITSDVAYVRMDYIFC